jgi:hypothetical protein
MNSEMDYENNKTALRAFLTTLGATDIEINDLGYGRVAVKMDLPLNRLPSGIPAPDTHQAISPADDDD